MAKIIFDPEEQLRKEKEKAEWRVNALEQYRKELLANPEYAEYAKQYRLNPGMLEEFARHYANDKIQWMEWGEQFRKWQEDEDMQWINDAFDRLKEIQQKKLFDMQCLWRAEQLEIPGIVCCDDFSYWEFHIFNCPFLDKITPEELSMYQQYLESMNFEFEQGWFDRWQDYDMIKGAYNEAGTNRNFPDWYDFYNGRTGKSIYFTLPNTRGDKEEFYISLWRKEFLEKNKKMMEDPNTEKRPFLNYHEKDYLKWFVETYDDKETQKIFEDYGEVNWDSIDDELDENIKLLSEEGFPLPIHGWFDWKEAIQKIADNLRLQKIAEALPEAYQQYCMQYDMNLGFPEDNPDYWKENTERWKGYILRGRELNGEPMDFDF